MTKEMAEQMNGPTGDLASLLTDHVLGEFDRWCKTQPDATPGDVYADLADYLPHSLCTLLTEMQLTGVVIIPDPKEDDQ